MILWTNFYMWQLYFVIFQRQIGLWQLNFATKLYLHFILITTICQGLVCNKKYSRQGDSRKPQEHISQVNKSSLQYRLPMSQFDIHNKWPTGLNDHLGSITHSQTYKRISIMHLIKISYSALFCRKKPLRYGNDHPLPYLKSCKKD